MKKLKIGIVGCGAIGTSLCSMIKKRFFKTHDIVALCDLDIAKAKALKQKLGTPKVVSLQDVIRLSDLVVECASAKVSFEVAKQALTAKRDVLIMSIGGLLGKEKVIFNMAQRYGKRIYLPSGAICGLDGIRGLALVGIKEITLETRKPPQALKGADFIVKNQINLDAIKKDTLIFNGHAQEAVKAFPQNINVVALLSIAAKGQVVPRVKILACPRLKRNVHSIIVKSKAGRLCIRCENVPSPDNPKTSYLAILSAAATLRGISDFTRVGT